MPTVSRFLGVLGLSLAVITVSRLEAQMVTRWVQPNGVVTFTISPPPPGVKYDAVRLPSYRAKSAKKGHDGGAKPGETETAANTEKSGPAQLEVKDQSTTSLGDAEWMLTGTVTNEGGAAANGVGIRISVLEDGQGNPCLEDQGSVSPSTLQPGESGKFELTFNSPCFFGGPQIDIIAQSQ